MKCEEDDPIYRKVARGGNDSNLILQVTCHCVVVINNRVLHEISGCLFRAKWPFFHRTSIAHANTPLHPLPPRNPGHT